MLSDLVIENDDDLLIQVMMTINDNQWQRHDSDELFDLLFDEEINAFRDIYIPNKSCCRCNVTWYELKNLAMIFGQNKQCALSADNGVNYLEYLLRVNLLSDGRLIIFSKHYLYFWIIKCKFN